MIRPMTTWQKWIAYSSLAFVGVWTVLGVAAIVLIVAGGE